MQPNAWLYVYRGSVTHLTLQLMEQKFREGHLRYIHDGKEEERDDKPCCQPLVEIRGISAQLEDHGHYTP